MPHWGRPQPPCGDSQIGSERLELTWAAGTLSSFSSFRPPQVGHAGRSSPRTNSSKRQSHFSQLYS